MTLKFAFFCLVAFLLLAPVFCHAAPAEKEEMLISLSSDSIESLKETVKAIEDQNGEVRHVFAPSAIIAKLEPESVNKLREMKQVKEILPALSLKNTRQSPARTAQMPTAGEKAIGTARQALNSKFEPKSPRKTEPAPIANDMMIDFEWKPSGANRTAGFGPAKYPEFTFSETSEFLIGSTIVKIIFEDSNGSVDSESEDWTSTEEANAISEIYNGLDWWINNSMAGSNISWVYDINYSMPTSYEPITRPYTDESQWIQESMQAFGYTSYADYRDNVRDYLNDLRDLYGTDWAFAIFLVDSSNDSDGMMSDNYFAYAWLGGPHTVMTYDNDGYGIGNMDVVIAHETGHIFGALDQYSSSGCTCTETGGYLSIQNQNCENSCSSNVASIMRGQIAPYNSGSIDEYAQGQLGWRDTDSDGVLDPIEQSDSTNPSLAEIEYNPRYKYGSFVSGTLWARSLASDAYSGVDVNSCKFDLNGTGLVDGNHNSNYCYVWGLDISGSETVSSLDFNVADYAGNTTLLSSTPNLMVDSTGPTITNISATREFSNNSGTVLFTASVTDQQSDVNSAMVYIYVSAAGNSAGQPPSPDAGTDSNWPANPNIPLYDILYDDNTHGDLVTGDGNYSVRLADFNSTLDDGNYSIHVLAYDYLFNADINNSTATVFIDSVNPTAPTLAALPEITDQNSVLLDWSSSPGSDSNSGIDYYTVWRYADETWQAVAATTDTNYLDEELADKNYGFKIQVFDRAGNDANSGVKYSAVDTTDPNIMSVSPENNSDINTSQVFEVTYTELFLNDVNFYWKDGDDESYTQLSVSGCSSGTAQTCNVSPDLSAYEDGNEIMYYFQLSDRNSGVADSKLEDGNGYTATIDFTAPETIDDTTTAWRNSDFNVLLSCSDSGGGCYSTSYKLDFGAWTDGNIVLISTDGNHRIDFNSTDFIGNKETTKIAFALLDKTSPSYTDFNVSTNTADQGDLVQFLAWISDSTTVALTAYVQKPDGNTIQELAMLDDGLNSDGSAGDNLFGTAWDTTGTVSGIYFIDLNAVDDANNSARVQNLVVVIGDSLALVDSNSNMSIDTNAGFTGTDTNTGLDLNVNSGVSAASVSVVKSSEVLSSTGPTVGLVDLNIFLQVTVSENLAEDLNTARLKLYYSEADVNAAGLDENGLLLYKWSADKNKWMHPSEYALDYNVEVNNNYVWSDVNGFSSFVLAADNAPPAILSLTADRNATISQTITFILTDANSETNLVSKITIPAITSSASMTNNQNGTYTYAWTTTGASAGSYGVWASLTDLAGNSTDNSASPTTVSLTAAEPAPTPTPDNENNGGGGGGGGSGTSLPKTDSEEPEASLEENIQKISSVLSVIEKYGLEKTAKISEAEKSFKALNLSDDSKISSNKSKTESIIASLPVYSEEIISSTNKTGEVSAKEIIPVPAGMTYRPLEIQVVSEVKITRLDYNAGKSVFVHEITRSFSLPQGLDGLYIEEIPKEVTGSAEELIVGTGDGYSVIEDDPIVSWNLDAIKDGKIEYALVFGEKKDFSGITNSIVLFKKTESEEIAGEPGGAPSAGEKSPGLAVPPENQEARDSQQELIGLILLCGITIILLTLVSALFAFFKPRGKKPAWKKAEVNGKKEKRPELKPKWKKDKLENTIGKKPVHHKKKATKMKSVNWAAFSFWYSDMKTSGSKEFRHAIAKVGEKSLEHHAGHHDFSEYLREFHGNRLAGRILKIENSAKGAELRKKLLEALG